MTSTYIEAFIAKQAFYRYSFVAVPIHDLRNPDKLIEVIKQTEMKAVIVSQKVLPLVLQSLKECSTIKTIIVAGIYISTEQSDTAANHGVKLVKFANVEYDGSRNPLAHVKPDPEDVAMINYNTVSNSLSNGVMLTHSNLVAAMTAFTASLPGAKKFTSKDRLLCQFSNGDVISVWLSSAIILAGGSLVFTTGLMKNVLHDAQASVPTVFASTPVILDKIREALQLSYGNSSLFKRAFAAKLKLLKAGRVTATSFWDFIGLGEIRSKLGGNVRLIVTTTRSDPARNETMEYFRVAMGILVVSTFGRTETSGIATSRNIFDYSEIPHVGGPVGCNEIKLIDEKEEGYTSNDDPNPRGEILIRGPNVMKGYYKKHDAIADPVDKDGWFHSGDFGSFQSNGTLEVFDKKESRPKSESPVAKVDEKL
ncbi:hypothetical protein BGZ65_007748 [Modicella reniformis]|uniref:AMP-dependent synthetase/ligase domain-containing protein n=1 Tax=Modicella reniformis TaxID=1440133 RepID=A0A9P6IJK0_9FUNG|nr:hypothetical protein BGZ65_007748 [Modicella reniformis]